jgi:hypothetical protein
MPEPTGLAGVTAARLGASIARTLEDAAFVFAGPADEGDAFEGEVVEARLGWSGPHAGELRLAMGPALAAVVAANLLGVDEAAEHADDAVGELANMAAGVLLGELFGAHPPRLGLPRVARLVAARAGARAAAERAVAVALVDEEGRRIEAHVARHGEGQP